MNYCYSNDGEIYDDDIESATCDLEVGDVYYRGVSIPAEHSDFFNGPDPIIEAMHERVCETVPEFLADGYLCMTDEETEDLSRLIINWLDANVDQPTFSHVGDVEKIIFRKIASTSTK